MVELLYSTLAAVACFLSAAATGIVVIKLQRHWELSISSVRWLFYMFFLSICVWAALRCAFFIWMINVGDARRVNPDVEKALTTTEQLDMIAVHSIPRSTLAHNIYLALLILAGDVALLAVGVWIMALTYELGKIAIKSMDRGPKLEAKRIRVYRWLGLLLLGAYGVVELAIIIREGGYTKATHILLLLNLALHVCGLVYMSATLTFIKNRGRKYEPMHGIFVTSPVYQRLKRIMIVYALFASQFHISSILLSAVGTASKSILPFMGISLIVFTFSGLALSIITICSQACVLQMCSACVPEDLEAQFMQLKVCRSNITTESLGPPEKNPVFVYTDIESSSALWALAGDGVMDKATDIHDNIMRSSLPRHDGYEITTCGDSFQLAFPTIQDAVAFCVDVQLQLLVAPWPKELHGLVPATKKQRSGHRLIFSGLRVRMGIHDSIEDDGALVCERHAITGNMTYTGASEAIAGEVSELGRGGQILVTQRIAEWVQVNNEALDVDLKVEFLGQYRIRVLESDKGVYQLVPSLLVARRKYWPVPTQSLRSTTLSLSFVGTSPLVTTTTGFAMRSRSFPEMVIPTPPTPANTPKLHSAASLVKISLGPIPESPVLVTDYVSWPSTGRASHMPTTM